MNHWITSGDSARRLLSAGGVDLALHEAGHAVAQLRLEILGSEVRLAPTNGAAAVSSPAAAEPILSSDEAAARVLSCCAGYGALVAAGYDRELAALGCDNEFLEAANLIQYWGLDGDLETWQRKAVTLMSFPRNVVATEMVASHLARQLVLPGDYVEMLVDLADGAITQADFEAFQALRGS